jgi:hypothetical protein
MGAWIMSAPKRGADKGQTSGQKQRKQRKSAGINDVCSPNTEKGGFFREVAAFCAFRPFDASPLIMVKWRHQTGKDLDTDGSV